MINNSELSIGLLISNPVDRKLLRNFLIDSKFKATEIHTPIENKPSEFSIIITDERNAKQYSTDLLILKKYAAPLALPVLILIKKNSESYKWFKIGFNEVLQIPTFKTEFLAKLKILQQHREESENQYRLIFESLNVGIYSMTLEHKILKANPAMLAILGFKNFSQIENKSLIDLNISGAVERAHFLDDLKKNKKASHETLWKDINGNKIYVRENATIFSNPTNSSYYYHGTVEDITKQKYLENERKEYEEKIISSLSEKEALLKEVYHRVKNNLQVVSSLLNLQSKSIKDPTSKQFFIESSSRVKAMGLIHELLYRSTNLAKVEMKEYVRNLLKNLTDVYHGSITHIKTHLDIDPIALPIDDAVPSGLILNEIISNSFKHAFPLDKKGEISVTIKKSEEQIMIEVRDNGIGFDINDVANSKSLGLRLVQNLTKQLKGTIKVHSDHGSISTLIFPFRGQ